jgi:hypothetical protein
MINYKLETINSSEQYKKIHNTELFIQIYTNKVKIKSQKT